MNTDRRVAAQGTRGIILLCLVVVGCTRGTRTGDAAKLDATTVAADGGGAGEDVGPRLASPDDALAAFLTAWNLSVLPHARESERGLLQAVDRAMREMPDKLTALREPCRESKATVERIQNQTGNDYVVYGTLGELDRDGDCWRVMYEGGMKLEVIGYLDPASGKVLAVWRVPEG